MKASRILAGMSAAAFAASLLTMVSYAAEPTPEPTPEPTSEERVVKPTDFGAQFYVMGGKNWNWASDGEAAFTEDGTWSAHVNVADVANRSKKEDDETVGRAGVQVYFAEGALFGEGAQFKANLKYEVTKGTEETTTVFDKPVLFTVVKKGDKYEAISGDTDLVLAENGSSWADLTAYGEVDMKVTMTDLQQTAEGKGVEAPEPATGEGFDCFEMFASSEWGGGSNWGVNDGTEAGGHGKDVKISPDEKHYEVSFGPSYDLGKKNEKDETVWEYSAPATKNPYVWQGAGVWNVDIVGLAAAAGASTKGVDPTTDTNGDGTVDKKDSLTNKEKKKLAVDAGIKITNVKLIVNGDPIATIPDDKLLYGDIEGNGNLRIEISNRYGSTSKLEGDTFDPDFFDQSIYDLTQNLQATEVGVAFDIEGVPEEKEEEEKATHKYALLSDKGNTEETVNMTVNEEKELFVYLTDDKKPVAKADIVWDNVSKTSTDESAASGLNAPIAVIGDGSLPLTGTTDENGCSGLKAKIGEEGVYEISATYTDEEKKDYVVTYTLNVTKPESSSTEDSSSNSSSSSSNSSNTSSSAANSDNNPATGAAALGTVGVLLAGAAMAVSKKKK